MIDISELRNLSRQELEDKILTLKKSLYGLISQKGTGRIEKPSTIRESKRDIARILTVLSEMKNKKGA